MWRVFLSFCSSLSWHFFGSWVHGACFAFFFSSYFSLFRVCFISPWLCLFVGRTRKKKKKKRKRGKTKKKGKKRKREKKKTRVWKKQVTQKESNMWSAIPVALCFALVMNQSERKQGSGPKEGQSLVEHRGTFFFACSSVHPLIPPLPQALLGLKSVLSGLEICSLRPEICSLRPKIREDISKDWKKDRF